MSDTLSFPTSGIKLSYNSSPSSLYGTIDLGLAPNAPRQPITFVLTSLSTQQTQTVTVPIGQTHPYSPNFSFGVPVGYYNVTAQGSKWLRKNLGSFYVDDLGIFPNINTTLIGGDANGDNSVDATDFGIFVSAYNTDSSIPGGGYDVTADFNCDGMVDATDFGILVSSYNQMGAP